MKKFIATQNDNSRSILKFLESIFNDVPKSRLEKLFRKKDIKVNGKRISDKKMILTTGDEVEVYGLRFSTQEFQKVLPLFKVVFEDENILVVDKPIDIEIHGPQNSLDNQVISYLNFQKKDSFVPSHMGRIDKVTTGIVVYGKNYHTLRELKEKNNLFVKKYRMISNLNKNTTLDAFIFHAESEMKEKISTKFGKKAITEFVALENNQVEATLYTGRKHQIRASLEYLGFPIKGDTKYGGEPSDRVYLHSYSIQFKGLSSNLEYLNSMTIKADAYF